MTKSPDIAEPQARPGRYVQPNCNRFAICSTLPNGNEWAQTQEDDPNARGWSRFINRCEQTTSGSYSAHHSLDCPLEHALANHQRWNVGSRFCSSAGKLTLVDGPAQTPGAPANRCPGSRRVSPHTSQIGWLRCSSCRSASARGRVSSSFESGLLAPAAAGGMTSY